MLRRSAQLLLSSEIRWFEGIARSDFGFSFMFLTKSLVRQDLVRNIKENPKSDPSNHRISKLKRSWADLRRIGTVIFMLGVHF